jgi:hypothetical protein
MSSLRPLLALVVVAAAGAAGCGPEASPAPASAASPAPASAAPSIGPTAGSESPLPATTQTETEWGRIWDAVPAGFPLPAGAAPTQTREGPVSGTYAVAAAVEALSGPYRVALERAGFAMESVAGPLEDDSVVIDAVGPVPGCRAQVSLRPFGGPATTLLVVLYGADCPFR